MPSRQIGVLRFEGRANGQGGPAKDISFEFSEPVESSDGFVLSELPFFINPLEHNWDINPRLYEGIRSVDYSGMTDLVDVIDRKIADDAIADASFRNRDGSG